RNNQVGSVESVAKCGPFSVTFADILDRVAGGAERDPETDLRGRAPTRAREPQQAPRQLRSSVETYRCGKRERHAREQRGNTDGVRPAGVGDRGEAETDH